MLEQDVDKILDKVYNMEMNPYVAKKRIFEAFNKCLQPNLTRMKNKLQEAIDGV